MSHIRPQTTDTIDRSAIRPRRFWYVIAGLCALLGIAAGATAFVLTLTNTPNITHRFGDDEPTTVPLTAGQTQTIWVQTGSPGGYGSMSDLECQVVSAQDGSPVTAEPYRSTVTFSNSQDAWLALFDVTAAQTGDYTIECHDPTDHKDVYGFGGKLDVGSLVGGIGAVFLLPLLGFVIGAVIVIVVAVRRSRSRNRLLHERRAGQW